MDGTCENGNERSGLYKTARNFYNDDYQIRNKNFTMLCQLIGGLI